MTVSMLFAYPDQESMTQTISDHLHAPIGQAVFRSFPDGESYVRLLEEVKGKKIAIVCSLNQPDPKLIPLLFFAKTAKDLGVTHVTLIAPYLAYMRQDTRFHPGESFSSKYFAALISQYFDALITVDPHLHRHKTLDEVYSIPTYVLHAAPLLAAWIREHVKQPLIMGPDSESRQWVSQVADLINAPYQVLEKERHGDKSVSVSFPQVEQYRNYTPIVVDDVISTAHTMIEVVEALKSAKMKKVICMAVHAVFAGDAFKRLSKTHVRQIVTCNTITHPSNAIDLGRSIAEVLSSE
ncbi:MAG: ribose-phosphate pyrophosphokinase [Gammaproteobacteria bacterium]|nr:ribose-phosphate pyrophosphokinase [Gammaproteobacteria bacterium]